MTFFKEMLANDKKMFLVHMNKEHNLAVCDCQPFLGTIEELFAEYQQEETQEERFSKKNPPIWFREASRDEIKYILHVYIPSSIRNLVEMLANFSGHRRSAMREIDDLIDQIDQIHAHYGRSMAIDDGDGKLLSLAAAEDRLEKNEMFWVKPKRID